MFNWNDTIRNYYTLGLYSAEQVTVFILAGWITQQQADEIMTKQPAA